MINEKYALYIIIAILLAVAGYYSFRLFEISKNKVPFARARELNNAIELCILSAEKVDEDQINEYRKGWIEACVHIGVELSEIRDETMLELK